MLSSSFSEGWDQADVPMQWLVLDRPKQLLEHKVRTQLGDTKPVKGSAPFGRCLS